MDDSKFNRFAMSLNIILSVADLYYYRWDFQFYRSNRTYLAVDYSVNFVLYSRSIFAVCDGSVVCICHTILVVNYRHHQLCDNYCWRKRKSKQKFNRTYTNVNWMRSCHPTAAWIDGWSIDFVSCIWKASILKPFRWLCK